MRKTIAKKQQASRGFTLLEVLIAVALVSAIFVIVAGALQFSVRAWRASNASITATQDVAFAQSIMRQSLEDAYPRLAGAGAVEFTGAAESVRFIGQTPNALNAPARAYIDISAEETENGAENGIAIVIAFRPEFTSDTVRETLIDGLSNVSFSYLPPRRDGAPEPEWSDHWTGAARLPALIKVDARFPEGDRRAWPPLIIAPQIDVDAACRYDPLTHFCQGRRQ